jgi:hypothetical protein
MSPADMISEMERLAKRHEVSSAKFLGKGQKVLAGLAKARAEGLREAIEVVQEQAAAAGEVAGA